MIEVQNRGGDIEITQNLEFMEAAKGVEKDLSFRSAVKCAPCNGSGSKSGTKPQTCKVRKTLFYLFCLSFVFLLIIFTFASC
jgi:DnaJ-class molecular chaperone